MHGTKTMLFIYDDTQFVERRQEMEHVVESGNGLRSCDISLLYCRPDTQKTPLIIAALTSLIHSIYSMPTALCNIGVFCINRCLVLGFAIAQILDLYIQMVGIQIFL